MSEMNQTTIITPRQRLKLAQWDKLIRVQDDWFEGWCRETLRATVAVAAGLELGLTSLWLAVLAPSSTGKTRIYVEPIVGAPHAEKTGQLFISGLLTSVNGKAKGLLQKHAIKWLWVEPELSELMELDKNKLADMLTAMRQLYDGNYRRDFKNTSLVHCGRVNFVGAGTNAFDYATSVHKQMGERLVSIRPQPCIKRAVGDKVRKQGGVERMMASQQHEAIEDILTALTRPTTPQPIADRIWNLALVITEGRRMVKRNFHEEIIDVLETEGPGRLYAIFIAFAEADAATHGLDEVGEEQMQLIIRLALDTLYLRRGQVLRTWLLDPKARFKQNDVRKMSGIKWPSAFKYVTTELNALGVVLIEKGDNNESYLRLSDKIAEHLSLSMV